MKSTSVAKLKRIQEVLKGTIGPYGEYIARDIDDIINDEVGILTEEEYAMLRHSDGSGHIHAIKALRSRKGITLVEAKDIVLAECAKLGLGPK